MNTPLDRAFNTAVLHIASRLMPTGYDVAPIAPSSLDSLRCHVAATGRILVWSGESDRTIFADPEVNWAFRAWHDWCHLTHGLEFTTQDEVKVALVQMGHIRTLYGHDKRADRFCALIDAEVIGQIVYQQQHGEFPHDQMTFTREYLGLPA